MRFIYRTISICFLILMGMSHISTTHAQSSVLASGKWYKIKIDKDGLFKISGKDLQSMGFSISKLNVNHIRLYGNGGGMLPEANSVFRHNDLAENAIQIRDINANGFFDENDYLIFYGIGPKTWKYNTNLGLFTHQKHLYDDYAYYFITVRPGMGKRVASDTTSYSSPSIFVNDFVDFAFHENDSLNLIKAGREWYGEQFDLVNSHNFRFSFPNTKAGTKLFVRTDVIARSTSNSSIVYKVNNSQKTLYFSASSSHYLAQYANIVNDTFSIENNSSLVNMQLMYNKPNTNAQAWLNYIELNTTRHLTMYGEQMAFRNPEIISAGKTAEYTVKNINSNTQVWEITNPISPVRMNTTINGTTLKFSSHTDSLKTFVAHSGSYLSPSFVGEVENQDLHSLSNIDYVILYHPRFTGQANKLADFHRKHSQLTVLTVKPQTIYNEFSSGAKDISAIRDFMKMLYDKADGNTDKQPKYLLLFGDASYDFKNRTHNNTNLIFTYESGNSLSPTNSFCTDDFFGLLDENEGDGASGNLDIGIGRFPVTTTKQADGIIDKILRYTNQSNSSSCSNNAVPALADWRNIVCFIGDDEDGSSHMSQADYLADYVANNHSDYNVEKIFFDAYTQVTTPGGQRYPEVNNAINQRVGRGALVVNYTGHGGEEGWSHESVLEVNDILAWENCSNLPLFITATCEFSRYDDPERISAGEHVLLNPNGGGIALLTTSRVTYSATNFALSQDIYENLFKKQNGRYPSIGDVIRISKNGVGSISANKNFVLLGDPALKLAYPYDDVVTTAVLDDETGLQVDTIMALQRVRIKGEIQRNGQLLTDFNGTVFPTIFDKAQTYSTLGNDEDSPVYNFKLQNNIIYRGKAKVKEGKFEFVFVVPKDISYKFGEGKVSYYANNEISDANGYTDSLNIGGSYPLATDDFLGPEIDLYINDTQFIFGGLTDANPTLLAYIFDENGINTVGNGIGHDITAILDEHSTQPIILNDFYEADLGNYKRGTVRYPFFDLEDGLHTLSIKVWDVYNNSAEAYTEFIVASEDNVVIDNLLNAPNPFRDKTSIIFEHNQDNDILEVQVLIYNTTGQLVRELQANVNSSGYRVGPNQLVWDGTGSGNFPLAPGVYIYVLRVQNSDGSYEEKSSKMVLLR